MNGVILHEYCVCNLPVQVVTFHLHMQMEKEPCLMHTCILVSQAARMYAIYAMYVCIPFLFASCI